MKSGKPTTQKPVIRKSHERGRTRMDWLESWHSFSFGDYIDPAHHHFGALRVINEDIVSPGGGFATHGHRDMEIITYVLSGRLAHKDSLGNGSEITPGEIQRMSAGSGIEHSEFNPSDSEPVHLLQIWLFPDKRNLPPSYEQKRLVDRTLKNQWQFVASPTGCNNSVTIHQDATLSVALLEKGGSVSHALREDRQAWIQIATGEVTLNGEVLSAGDAAGITQPGDITLTAGADSEVLLFDLAAPPGA